jgi:Arc/MetJ family transcription regulator
MRTTLNLDDETLQAAMQVAANKTKTEIINQALREFVQRKHRLGLLEWRGKLTWEGDIDRLRKRE